MANTQTTVPLFVANQVLTAAQQNASAGTGVPVFATTVTRDAAFGGSNKALAEGQLAYIEASNTVQYYDGASWIGASGFSIVQPTTAFSAVTTLNKDSVFTSSFTNYRMVIEGVASGATNVNIAWRASGTTNTTANNYLNHQLLYGSDGGNLNTANGGVSAFFLLVTSASANAFSVFLDIANPATAKALNYTGRSITNVSGIIYDAFMGGQLTVTTAYDGFALTSSTANTLTGNYTIYGYNS
jgi:hypothetical protein